MEPRPPFTVSVQCYAGHRGEESPRRFRIGDRTIEVDAVLDRWLGPDHRYFKVRVHDGDVYVLRHDVTADAWELTVYTRGTPPPGGGVAQANAPGD